MTTTRREVGEPSPIVVGLALVAVIIIFGFTTSVTRLVTAPALVAVSVRFWFTTPVTWLIAALTGRRVSVRILRSTALAGVCFGLNLVFIFSALRHAAIAVIVVVLSLQPGVMLVTDAVWLKEPITRWHAAWTLVGVAGVGVVLAGGGGEVHTDALGILFAVLALLSYSLMFVLTRRARSTTSVDPIQWMAGVNLFAALTVTPMALATSSVADYRQLDGADWLYVLGFLAIVSSLGGHTGMSWIQRYVPASRSSLYLLAANLVAILAAWPINHQPVTVVQVLGSVVVIGAVAAVVSRPTARGALPAQASEQGMASEVPPSA